MRGIIMSTKNICAGTLLKQKINSQIILIGIGCHSYHAGKNIAFLFVSNFLK